MSRPATTVPRTWVVAHGLLAAAAVLTLDGLLLKFTHSTAAWVPVLLIVILGLALVLRRAASRAPALRPDVLHRAWRGLDGPNLAWLAFYGVLLVVFHGAFERASGDGREYFAQLHSLVMDRNLDLSDEARDFGAGDAGIFPFGSALLWLPFYLLAHAWIGVLNLFGAGLRHDGYYYPYQMAVGLGTLTYGYAGLVLVYRVLCDYFSRWLSLVSTMVVCVASFVFWYLAVDSSYTHGNSLFAVALFLWLWHRTRAARSRADWAWLGLAGGLMTMVRWQNAVFLVPLVVDAVSGAWRGLAAGDRGRLAAVARGVTVSAAAFVAGFLPQMYFWKAVHGGWLAVPHGQAGQQWWADPLVLDVLFSPNHGLLAWHPVLYLSLVGVPVFVMRDWRLGSLLVVLFALQVYVNGAVTTWWGGAAFGARRFDGCVLLFALGLASLIQWTRERPALVWALPLGALVAGNAFFMREVRDGNLPMDEAIGIERIVGATVARLGNPFSFPGNAIFAWRTGLEPAAYDRLGARRFNNVRIDMGETGDEGFLGSGWADRERNPQISFRWGVTDRSTIGVALMGPRYVDVGDPLRLSNYVLGLRVAPFAYPGSPPQTLAVDVNGREVASLTLDPSLKEYTVPIDRALLRRSLNGLTFRYGYARSPRDAGVGDDRRPLAVLFDAVNLVQESAAR